MKTDLRQRMIEDMQLRGLTRETQQVYLDAIQALAQYYHCSPGLLSEQQVRDYYVYLKDHKGYANNTVRIHIYALKFLFTHTLNRDWPVLGLVRVKSNRKLPVVLSRDEVRELLALVRRPAVRLCLTVMYACGLRISEATALRIDAIDSRRMQLEVRNGKGNKSRCVPLPQRTLQQLRDYWLMDRPSNWLFPARDGSGPIANGSVRGCLSAALKESTITKKVSCHTFRHSYATELLDNGLDIRAITALLGHKSLKTTMIYLHMTEAASRQVHVIINRIIDSL